MMTRSMLTLVTARSEAPAEFSAADYLQLGRANRRTFRVEVGTGHIDLVDGELYAARDESGVGTEALMRLLILGGLSGEARARCYDGEPAGDRNLDVDLENALLEAARRVDEGRRAPPPPRRLPSVDAEPTKPPPLEAGETGGPALETAREAIEAGVAAILARDYAAARAAFHRAVVLGDTSALVRTNLERLDHLLG